MKYRILILAVALMTMAAPVVAQTGVIITGPVQDGNTVLPNQVNPAAFGTVDPTGQTDSTAAFQAAINTGKQVSVPPGIYNVCGLQIPDSIQLVGPANNRQRQAFYSNYLPTAELTCSTGDIFDVISVTTTATIPNSSYTITVANNTGIIYNMIPVGTGIPPGTHVESISGNTITLSAKTTSSGSGIPVTFYIGEIDTIGISGLKLSSLSGGGHIFNFGSQTYVVDFQANDVLFNQQNPNKSWITGSGGFQESKWNNIMGNVAAANTIPAVQLDGAINVMDIGDLNITSAGTSGSYSAHYLFEFNQNSGTANNIHIHDLICEIATAGCINLNNVGNASIDDVINYDQLTTPTAPFIAIGGSSINPVAGVPTGTPAATGGTVATGNNYAKIVAVDSYGLVTNGSTESAIVVTSTNNSTITWNWSAAPGASSYRIFVGATSGGEAYFFTSNTNSYTQTTPITSGTPGNVTPGASQVELKSVFSDYGTASVPDFVCPAGVCEFHNSYFTISNLGGVITDQRIYAPSHYLDYTPAQQTDAALMGVWSSEDGFSGGGKTGNLLGCSDNLGNTCWYTVASGAGSAPHITATGITDPFGGTNAVQVNFAIGSGATGSDYSEYRQNVSPTTGVGTYTVSAWVQACSGTATFTLNNGLIQGQSFTATTAWQRFFSTGYNSSSGSQIRIGLNGSLTPAAGTQCIVIYGVQFTPGIAIHPYVSTTLAGAALPIQPRLVMNGQPVLNKATPGVPTWTHYQLTQSGGYWSWTGTGPIAAPASALTQNFSTYTILSPHTVFEGFIVKPTTACTGATTATIQLGDGRGSPTYYTAAYDITTVSDTAQQTTNLLSVPSWTTPQLYVYLVTTGNNISSLTSACTVDVWIKADAMP